MDAALTFACALDVEERVARRAGAPTALVGLGARRPLPDGPLVSFGFCGALVPGLEPGTLLTATRVVDAEGAVLWEGEPFDVPGALRAVVCAAEAVSEPAERRRLAERSGAVAVDMESGVLASTGRLAGVLRAVSDAADESVGRLVRAGKPDGRTDWGLVLRAALLEPVTTLRTAIGARRAMRSLARAAEALA
jgi:adenosylhomocysteine nucleosidase